MPYSLKDGFNIRLFVIVISAILLVFYGVFNARNLIFGPSIELFSPSPEVEARENVITVKGAVKNAAFISLNEKPIFVNKDGLFEEKLLLSPGSNIIEIKARDRFKKELKKTIKIYYKPIATSTSEIQKEN